MMGSFCCGTPKRRISPASSAGKEAELGGFAEEWREGELPLRGAMGEEDLCSSH
jgi:hypothetical protein